MSLEELISDLTKAIKENTAAVNDKNELLRQNIDGQQEALALIKSGGAATKGKKVAAEATDKPAPAKAKKAAPMTLEAFNGHITKFVGEKGSDGYTERRSFFVKIVDDLAEEVNGKKNSAGIPEAKRAEVVQYFEDYAAGKPTPYSEPDEDEEDEDLLG